MYDDGIVNGGMSMSCGEAWHVLQLPCGIAPMCIAMRSPSPVLNGTPRMWTMSQPGPEVARAHLRIRFEAAAREHDRLRVERGEAVRRQRAHAGHAALSGPG